jgi:hypothetical protein
LNSSSDLDNDINTIGSGSWSRARARARAGTGTGGGRRGRRGRGRGRRGGTVSTADLGFPTGSVRSRSTVEFPIPLEGISGTDLQIVGYGEALAAQGLVRVVTELGAVLESLEIDHPIGVLRQIGHQSVLVLIGWIGGGVGRGIDEDLEGGVGDVLIGATSSHMILSGPGQTDRLSTSVGSHWILGVVTRSQWTGRIISTHCGGRLLIVISSIFSKDRSSELIEVTWVGEAFGRFIGVEGAAIVGTSQPRVTLCHPSKECHPLQQQERSHQNPRRGGGGGRNGRGISAHSH